MSDFPSRRKAIVAGSPERRSAVQPSVAGAIRAPAGILDKLRAIAAEEGIPWDPEMTFEAFAMAVQTKRDERTAQLSP